MCNLILEPSTIMFSEHTPDWRDWVPDPRPLTTPIELAIAVDEIAKRLLDCMGNEGSRWRDVILKMNNLTEEQVAEFADKLRSVDPTSFTLAGQVLIWNALRETLVQNRTHDDANWALKQNIVDELEGAYERFVPHDIVLSTAWLFSECPSLLMSYGDDWNAEQQALLAERNIAIESVFASQGLAGLLSLAMQSENAATVGHTVGKSSSIEIVGNWLCDQLFSSDKSLQLLARGFIFAKHHVDGSDWVENQLIAPDSHLWTSNQRASFYSCLPFSKSTWDRLAIDAIDTQDAYWHLVGSCWLPDAADCERAVENLLKYNHPYEALTLLARHSRRIVPLPTELIVRALRETENVKQPENSNSSEFRHRIADLLGVIEKSEQTDKRTIEELEWQYFPYLSYSTVNTLHRKIAREPQFFIELLTSAYKGEHEGYRNLTEVDSIKYTKSNQLFLSWHITPGLDENGQFEPGELEKWVSEVRTLAAGIDRLPIADTRIGQALAYTPSGDDNIWPDKPIRSLLENVNSPDMELGLEIAIYNKRGVVSKSPLEGGNQEREIASKYRDWAVAMRDTCPRISSVLKKVSDRYTEMARHSNTQAEYREDTWK